MDPADTILRPRYNHRIISMAAKSRSTATNKADAPVPDLVHQRFNAALEKLIEQVKRDRSVLAAILCGSLSHDTVWEKSDIDLLLVTIDDKKTGEAGLALYADG